MSNSFLPNILTVLFGIGSVSDSEKPILCIFLASFLLCPPHVFLVMQIFCNSPKTLALFMPLCLLILSLFSGIPSYSSFCWSVLTLNSKLPSESFFTSSCWVLVTLVLCSSHLPMYYYRFVFTIWHRFLRSTSIHRLETSREEHNNELKKTAHKRENHDGRDSWVNMIQEAPIQTICLLKNRDVRLKLTWFWFLVSYLPNIKSWVSVGPWRLPLPVGDNVIAQHKQGNHYVTLYNISSDFILGKEGK